MSIGFFFVIWLIGLSLIIPLLFHAVYERNVFVSSILGVLLLLMISLGPTTKKYTVPCQLTKGTNSVLLECGEKSRVLTEVPVGFNDSSTVEIRGWYSIAGFKTSGDIYIDGTIHE